ncbi:MAG: HesA/MoeB/ThiF family protein [Spirochaetaceae bacterium]
MSDRASRDRITQGRGAAGVRRSTDRYARHRPLFSPGAWERLGRTRIVLAGMGGLGSHVAQTVARLAPVNMELWDPATVDEPDLNRQVLYRPEHLGAAKVEVAARELSATNPEIAITTYRRPITAAAFVDSAALTATNAATGTRPEATEPLIIMDCLDSFEARGALEDIRRTHGIPVVHAGVEEWFAQAALFPGGGHGPGYESVYGADFRTLPAAGKPVMPHVVALIASIQVGLLIEWLDSGEEGAPPPARRPALFVYDGKRRRLERVALTAGDASEGGNRGSG